MAKGREPAPVPSGKRPYLKQSDIPRTSLQEALRLAQGLQDDFGGRSAAPYQLAMALELSPTSSNWEDITGASIAYGLTEGGSRAATISLTDLGKKIVAPTEELQDESDKIEAALKPKICRDFFQRYDKAKFPQDKIAKNVLAEIGVPADRLDRVLQIIKENGAFDKIIHQTSTGPYVAIDIPLAQV
jgi:hypothetical protein